MTAITGRWMNGIMAVVLICGLAAAAASEVVDPNHSIPEAAVKNNNSSLKPILFNHHVFVAKHILITFISTDTIALSTDGGKTFIKKFKFSTPALTSLRLFHAFSDHSLLVATSNKCYYIDPGWTKITESAVLGLDGKPHTPALPGDNFFSLNGTVSQYIGDVEVLCWGCYNNNSPWNKSGLYVPTWFTKDKGKTVSLVYQNSVSIPANKTEPLQARHVHQVAQNPKDGSFWIQTGDEERPLFSHWIKGNYDIVKDKWVWNWIGSGDNYKTTMIQFKGDYMYFAVDLYPGGISKCLISEAHDKTKHVVVKKIENDLSGFVMGERGDCAIQILKFFGPDTPGNTIYYSPDMVKWYTILGDMPPGYTKKSVYIHGYPPDSEGRVLMNILLDYAHPSSSAGSAGAVWLNEIIANHGFPDAFKPLDK